MEMGVNTAEALGKTLLAEHIRTGAAKQGLCNGHSAGAAGLRGKVVIFVRRDADYGLRERLFVLVWGSFSVHCASVQLIGETWPAMLLPEY
ncbi:MAG: hypothetical protein IH624_05905 [Phycisphaerae bacterium]|nr:hypothetical protein [Phycisphaerae bacterium]